MTARGNARWWRDYWVPGFSGPGTYEYERGQFVTISKDGRKDDPGESKTTPIGGQRHRHWTVDAYGYGAMFFGVFTT